MKKLEELEQSIGYAFKNKNLLQTALTHTSYANEKHVESYEKLEFLGDSILEFLSSKYIYNNYPKLKEGEMTKVRATVVCEDSLYKVAQKHNFSDFLLLGKSETSSTTDKTKKAIMADTVEAIIAAMFFDSGIGQSEKFIIENLKEAIELATKHVGEKDYKTVLQEMLQRQGSVNIEYIIIKETGPDHDKSYTAEVKCNGNFLAAGEGRTKKAAEMQAAQKAIEKLEN